MLGPRDDWFHPSAIDRLLSGPYLVTSSVNRIGARLEGPLLCRRITRELISEGAVSGSVQVPPSGLPTLFQRDHPLTGGYPVIAVVVASDLDVAAQVRPGDRVRFSAVRRRTIGGLSDAGRRTAENVGPGSTESHVKESRQRHAKYRVSSDPVSEGEQ